MCCFSHVGIVQVFKVHTHVIETISATAGTFSDNGGHTSGRVSPIMGALRGDGIADSAKNK